MLTLPSRMSRHCITYVSPSFFVLSTMPRTSSSILRIAHRGMPRQARENTLQSFSLALDAGADGIELDVHATADGIVVVHHDYHLGDGMQIAGSTLAQLRASSSNGESQLATLRESCLLVAGRARLFVEIKGEGIENAVVATLMDYEGEVAIHSFDHALIGRLSARGCPFRLGILFDHSARSWRRSMEATGAADLWIQARLITPSLIREIHDAGAVVFAWTVNDVDAATKLAAMGVDGICTDDVSILLRC